MEATVPWNRVNIDLIGPLNVKTKSKKPYVLNALTMIDPAIWVTCHGILEATLGQLVFNRDMILPLKFNAEWAYIAQRQQKQIVKDNQRENAKRIAHEYQHVGDKVLYSKLGNILKKLNTP
jgi:uncharacterized protein YneF (UPF0154 family)